MAYSFYVSFDPELLELIQSREQESLPHQPVSHRLWLVVPEVAGKRLESFCP